MQDEYIKGCKMHLMNALGYFIGLQTVCEYYQDPLCTIPVSEDVPAGILRCNMHNCPLLKED